jgi:hypothetical protein
MVFFALILMVGAAITIDYVRVRREKKETEIKTYDSPNLKHIPA